MKFFGKIGFATTVESEPGVWEDTIVERSYYGDVLNLSRNYIGSDKINDDLTITNTISIISDPFAVENMYNLKYIIWNDHKWKVTAATMKYPRLELSLGGLWNEENEPAETRD